MQTQVLLSEAQQLFDAVNDPLLNIALTKFFDEQKQQSTEMLLSAVRQSVRDTMKEARLAGKVEAYDNCLSEMRHFAQEQLRSAAQ